MPVPVGAGSACPYLAHRFALGVCGWVFAGVVGFCGCGCTNANLYAVTGQADPAPTCVRALLGNKSANPENPQIRGIGVLTNANKFANSVNSGSDNFVYL